MKTFEEDSHRNDVGRRPSDDDDYKNDDDNYDNQDDDEYHSN